MLCNGSDIESTGSCCLNIEMQTVDDDEEKLTKERLERY